MAAIYSLYIINKSGGLIFYKDYGSAGRMDTNDSLRLASLWHSMHAISQQLSPISGCSGIELLEADTFDLHCFQSLTGESGKLYQGFKGTKGKLYATVVTRSRYQALNIQFVEHCNFSFEAVAEPEISPGGGLSGMGAIDVEQAVYEDDTSFGTKFFVVCEPGTQHMEGLLRYIYELYTDFVLKNPFYEMEMPIRCELFDINLAQAIQKDRVALLGR